MSTPVTFCIEKYGIEYSYNNFNDVIRHIVDSQYPFDDQDDSDVQVFLNEELDNEHSDLKLAQYELCERKTELANQLTIAKENSEFPQTIGDWTIWVK